MATAATALLSTSKVFTTPIPVQPESPDLIRAYERTAEELRLMDCAANAPLKIRWRRNWTPEKIAGLAQLYAPDRIRRQARTELELDRLAVNFLRHDKTAYEDIVHRNYGAIRGQLGEHPTVYLIVKARVNEAIAADFCWLADEAERQIREARARVAAAEQARRDARGRGLSFAA